DRLPLFVRQPPDRTIAGDAGVVHQDVQAAQLLDGPLHEAFDGGRVADVAPLAMHADPQLSDLAGGPLGRFGEFAVAVVVEKVEGDVGTVAGELEGDRAADAGGAAGDDHAPPAERSGGQ